MHSLLNQSKLFLNQFSLGVNFGQITKGKLETYDFEESLAMKALKSEGPSTPDDWCQAFIPAGHSLASRCSIADA